MDIIVFGLVLAVVIVTIILVERAFGRRGHRPQKLPVADTRDVGLEPKHGDCVFYAGQFRMFGSVRAGGVYRIYKQIAEPVPDTKWIDYELCAPAEWRRFVRDGHLVAKQGFTVEHEAPVVEAAAPTDLEQQRKAVAYQYKPGLVCTYCGSAHPAKGPCSFRGNVKEWDRDD